MSNQKAAVAAARAHRAAHGHEIIAEFVELLSLPNVSRDLDDVGRVADHIVAGLKVRGVAARTVARAGAAPLVVGHYRVQGATSTIGFYAHYDGQPIDQPDWKVDPFKPVLMSGPLGPGSVEVALPSVPAAIDEEWRIYARASSDDKAPVAAITGALDALRGADIEPHSNLLFIFEGEEEIGSPHLPEYLRELAPELSAADVWLICDGPVHQSRRPQIVFGVRGIAEMEITVYGPRRPLHSGHYGNWVFNPNMELARLLASMKDEAGNIVIDDFYSGTQPVTDADRAAVAALPDDDDALRAELGVAATEDGGTPLALRLLQPSLNVRGLQGGAVGPTAANVIPTEAQASIDIRLAPGNDPDEIMERVARHVASAGWHLIDREPDDEIRRSHRRIARLVKKSNYPGVRLPTDSPLAAALVAAAAVAADQDVAVVPTFGGSVPLHYFTTILDAPIAITPFANHDNNQHAANENIRIANLWYGIDLMASLMTMDVAALSE